MNAAKARPATAVIFDMDGVLTDSEWFIAEAARLMFQETHHTVVRHEDFHEFVGMGENKFLGGVAAKYGLAGFEIERDKARTYAIYVDIVRGKLNPFCRGRWNSSKPAAASALKPP